MGSLTGLAQWKEFAPRTGVPARFLFGKSQQIIWPHPHTLDLRRLEVDMTYRRQMAWKLMSLLFADIKNLSGFAIPAWQTFYSFDDAQRMARTWHAHPDVAFAELEDMHASQLRNMPVWQGDAFNEWLARILNPLQLRGVTGLMRTLYDAHTLASLFGSAERLKDCEKIVSNTSESDEQEFAPCLEQPLDRSTLIVKAAWQRLEHQRQIPAYLTNVASLRQKMSRGQREWRADLSVQITDDEIYTIELRDGSRFGLVGLHVMSKLLPNWWWMSLWWSPDTQSEFAQDKPSSDAIWQREVMQKYQLCTVTAHREAATSSGLPGDPYSWCSNPYLEKGHNNMVTNCIGCHQHAGTNLAQEEILNRMDQSAEAALGQTRKNFPADYVWSLGSELKQILRSL